VPIPAGVFLKDERSYVTKRPLLIEKRFFNWYLNRPDGLEVKAKALTSFSLEGGGFY